MDVVFTPTGVITFGIIAVLYAMFARHSALGALSLPSMSMLTSMVYFYVMPGLAFSGGDTGFLGVYIDSMTWVHFATFLYAMGVAAACFLGRRHLAEDPAAPRHHERPLNIRIYWALAAIAGAGLVVLTVTGRLNLTASDQFVISGEAGNLAFLQLSMSMLLPLTIVYAVRENFGIRAMAAIAGVAFVFLVSGFRFRIAILMIAVAAAYSLTRHRKIGVMSAALGTATALMLFNAIGRARRYGVGLDLSSLEGLDWSTLLQSFGGEIGSIHALYGVIEYPPPELIGADPWIIAIARLVPSFLWPDKPYPDYLLHVTFMFDDQTRQSAGIAGPQQTEMLMQFGWPGLFLLPMLYFSIAIFISGRLGRLSREARIAGAGLLPGLFGFYMQQRGYFFQNLSEMLFMLGPLFLMHVGRRKATHRSSVAKSREQDRLVWAE